MMLSLLSYVNYSETNKDSYVILAGIFSGLALGIKYISGMSIIAIIILLMLGKRWKQALKYALVCGLLFLPWGLKNFFFTGDPVYPFFQKLFFSAFGAGEQGEIVRNYFALFNQYALQSGYLESLLKFPFQVLMNEATRFAGGFDVLGGLGWALFIGLLPALLFVR